MWSVSELVIALQNYEDTYVREEHFDDSRAGDSSEDLCDEDHSSARVREASNESQTESYGRVEESAADTEEDPSADRETEAERQ